MRRLFGTDGIRGKANEYPMEPLTVMQLGQAIGKYFKHSHVHPKILIGKDTRRSGYMLEQALCAGICSVGVDVRFLGPLPTPGISYLTRGMRACAGIVISASHNPYEDNGIKIFSDNGYKLPDAVELQLEALVDKNLDREDFPVGIGVGVAKRIDDAVGQYAVYLKEQLPKSLTLEGVKIAVDCANGAAYKVAPKVFEELGADLVAIGVSPDGMNINKDYGALHPAKLAQLVREEEAAIGLAFDGDADRLVVVDEKGEILTGDQVIAICAIHLKQHGLLSQSTIVSTVMSNMGLDLALAQHGIKVVRTQVGDRHVVDKMCQLDLNFGGEQSGHLVFRDASTTGDGVLAGLMLLRVMRESGQPLSALKRCMDPLPQVLKNVPVAKKVPMEELTELHQEVELYKHRLGARGRILLRYSGTENLARIMIEGENTNEIIVMADDLAFKMETEIKRVSR